jgi:hypothetical protein
MSEREMMPDTTTIRNSFFKKVQLKRVHINYTIYEQSQSGVFRERRRIQRKMNKTKDPIEYHILNNKVIKLNQIYKDLQKALEL